MGRGIARFWGMAVAAMMPVVLIAGGAGAIVGGEIDEGHPNVGFAIAFDAKNGDLAEACTGTLIAETVVLTAAHCLFTDAEAQKDIEYAVTFKSAVTGDGNNQLREVTGFERNVEYDVGVLFLKDPVRNIEPADLPEMGALDGSLKGDLFTHVGYGADHVLRRGEIPTEFFRRSLEAPLTRLSTTQLFTRTRDGALCKGDSGGPVFDDDGVLVALGNYVSGNCKGTNSGPRLDIQPVQDFLQQYVG